MFFKHCETFNSRGIEYSDAEELQTTQEAFDRFYASFSKSPIAYTYQV